MKYLVLLLLLSIVPACASTGGVQTKQTLTFDVIKPTQDALIAVRDTEAALFRGGTIAALTPEAHQRILGKLELAFRSHAVATRALLTWQPGQPIPIDITQLQSDVIAISALLTELSVPPTTPLASAARTAIDTVNSLLARFGRP